VARDFLTYCQNNVITLELSSENGTNLEIGTIISFKYDRVRVVLATVRNRLFGSRSGSHPNCSQIGCQGCESTQTVNSGTVQWKSPNPSEFGGLSAGRPAGLSVDSYKDLAFGVSK